MSSPFDDGEWPEQMLARVVDPGPPLRLHGYAIDDDLARHRGVSDVHFLALTGELPNGEQARVFARTTVFLSGISVAEAPSHAAVLARICDGTTSAIIGTAAIVLAEQARFCVAEYRAGRGTASERSAALAELTGLALPSDAVAAAFAALEWCGLVRDEQLEAAFVTARLPVVIAEALATPPNSFRDYPLNVPRMIYEEDS